MMSLNIIGHCTNILEEMWFSSPPETSAEPFSYIYIYSFLCIEIQLQLQDMFEECHMLKLGIIRNQRKMRHG